MEESVMDRPQKQVKVWDYPVTYILIDADRDEAEAKARWIYKWKNMNKPIDQGQRNRERATIRGGRVYQQTKFKRTKN